MAFSEHGAHATWNGDLLHGSGTVDTDSGDLRDAAVSWPRRAEQEPGLNPEQLLAAAHASCFAMATSAQLAKEGHAATQLDVDAVVGVRKDATGLTIESVKLDLAATVDGLDQARFAELAQAAKEGCPISRALSRDVRVTLEATLRDAAGAAS